VEFGELLLYCRFAQKAECHRRRQKFRIFTNIVFRSAVSPPFLLFHIDIMAMDMETAVPAQEPPRNGQFTRLSRGVIKSGRQYASRHIFS